jgi:hypothetical protein
MPDVTQPKLMNAYATINAFGVYFILHWYIDPDSRGLEHPHIPAHPTKNNFFQQKIVFYYQLVTGDQVAVWLKITFQA